MMKSKNGAHRINLPIAKIGPCQGLRNGYGGKFDPDEGDTTILGNLERETLDESGCRLLGHLKTGVITFHWDREIPGLHRPNVRVVEVHIYAINGWVGQPRETEAFTWPEWFMTNRVPYHQMMPGQEIWMKEFLNHQPFTGEIWYETNSGGKITVARARLDKKLNHRLLNKP